MTRTAKAFYIFSAAHLPVERDIETKFPYFLFWIYTTATKTTFVVAYIIFKVAVITSSVVKVTFVVADITFKVVLITYSVAKITFVVAQITFRMVVITSSVVKITFVVV